MSKKLVVVNMSVVIEYDSSIYDEDEVVSKSVICFYEEDRTGVENFLPKADGLEVIEYLHTERGNIEND